MNWATGIDLKTGRPILDSTKLTGASKGTVKDICPSLEGGKSPRRPRPSRRSTGCSTSRPTTCAWTSRRRRRSTFAARRTSAPARPITPGPGGNLGAFIAWDAGTGQEGVGDQGARSRSGAARSSRRATSSSTARSTAGSRRWTRGPASCSGSSRWAPASSAIRSPISGPDGKQYVAVYAGIGGDWLLLAGDVRSDDPGRRAPAGRLRQGHRAAHQPGRHRLDLRARGVTAGDDRLGRGCVGLLAAGWAARATRGRGAADRVPCGRPARIGLRPAACCPRRTRSPRRGPPSPTPRSARSCSAR